MVSGRRTWALSLGLLGIFLAGAVTGVCAAAGYVHHRLRALHAGGPHALHALGMEWLAWQLDLEPDQEAAIEEVLLEAHLELFRFKSRHNDEINAIVLPALERIDAQLTPQQAESWRGIREKIVEHAEATLETRSGD
jgi:hypothetical protein